MYRDMPKNVEKLKGRKVEKMKKLMMIAAVCAAAGAFAASYISGAETAAGTMDKEGNAYTASELVHASDMSSYNLPASRGWVAGI